MSQSRGGLTRRQIIGGGAAFAASLAASGLARAAGPNRAGSSLRVWSCGGLAEAFVPANREFAERTGCEVAYTGAFAAALGKSLLGSATTEVFAPRVLALAKKLKAQGKMLAFQPLCFTSYVLITPKGNPAGIKTMEDLGRPGVRTVFSPDASPPGGAAALAVLKKAGVQEPALKSAVRLGSCVQHDAVLVAEGQADASIVELRVAKLPLLADRVEVLPIPESLFPAGPVPFTIGVMKWARDPDLAKEFVEFICSDAGQAHFAAAGFIPANSDEGRRLAEKYGVNDA